MNETVPFYYRNLNRRFLNSIPGGLKRVLEFGCASGVLGQQYKRMHPDTIWHGVEINTKAAKLAEKNIDSVWVMDANNFKPTNEMLQESYDAIIYGDVIEHLIDPIQCLPSHINLLKIGGELIACIPNIQHWTIIKNLLQGSWEYRKDGLLDNTHLRFFTRTSIYNMLRKLNLEHLQTIRFSYENDPRLFLPRKAEKDEILNHLKLFNEAAGLKFNELDFRTYQYMIRARRI